MWLNHKPCRLLLIIPAILFLVPALAGAGMVAGTVVSLNREQNTFTLELVSQQQEQDSGKITVYYKNAQLPQRLTTGKKIRAWGDYAPGSSKFIATDIRGSGKHHRYDPTGVRARLGKGKGRNCPAGNGLNRSMVKRTNTPSAQSDHSENDGSHGNDRGRGSDGDGRGGNGGDGDGNGGGGGGGGR